MTPSAVLQNQHIQYTRGCTQSFRVTLEQERAEKGTDLVLRIDIGAGVDKFLRNIEMVVAARVVKGRPAIL